LNDGFPLALFPHEKLIDKIQESARGIHDNIRLPSLSFPCLRF
jgi:hypothetical protein